MTPHSRASTSTVTHHGSSPSSDSPTNAIPMSALSAMGSVTLPKSVISPRLRAISPSMRSVSVARTNTPAAQNRRTGLLPPSASSSHA